MKKNVMSVFTRSPMHIGAGSSVGIVDLPIIRERHTGYPVIPGSSLKGVLADLWKEDMEKNDKGKWFRKIDSTAEKLFGVDNDPKKAATGNLLVGESRIVAFPVRSAKAGFAWVTCPLALGRYFRDANVKTAIPLLKEMECAAPAALCFDQQSIILEEYLISVKTDVPEAIVAEMKKLSDDSLWQEELQNHLVILSDEMFKYFVESTCEIAQHVKINDDTGTADGGALFNQENVPAETMFYTAIHELKDGCIDALKAKMQENNNLLQIGADATTGLGWCSVAFQEL